MSLYKRGGYWWIDVYIGAGRRRVRKSTGTADKTRAKIIEQSVIAANRNLTTRQRAITIIDNVLPQEERGLALVDMPAFYEECATGDGLTMTMNSFNHRINILSKFAMWAHDNTRAAYVEEVTATIAFQFVKALGGSLSAKTKNAYIGDLGTAWKMFLRHGKARENPWPVVRVQRNRDEEKTGRAFTQDEISRLLVVAGNVGHDWQTTIMIGLYTGLRQGDATRLKWADVDTKQKLLCVTPSKTSKRGITVRIPLHRTLAKWLENHRNESEYITPGRVGRVGRVGFKDGDKTFNELLTAAHITEQSDHDKLSFHCFRHTFITRLAEAGIAPDVRMRLAGHTAAQTHAIYTHDDMSARAAIDLLP